MTTDYSSTLIPFTPTLQLLQLTTGYRSRHVEHVVGRALDATLRRGELTCLLGSNGSGKSTLLRTLSGFQPALSGEIRLMGRALSSYRPTELAHVLGVVLTERPQLRDMMVEELVGMGRSPYTGFWGRLSTSDEAEVERAMSIVGLQSLRHRKVHTLSDGERQKCMIAKVLAQQTPVVLLDEPTAFLDFSAKAEMMQLLHVLAHEQQLSLLLSTHDLDLALQLADRLWLLDAQGCLHIGTPEDLALKGTLEHFFQGPGVEYQPETGLFGLRARCVGTIGLKSNDYRGALVAKALLRRGLSVQPPAVGSMWIDASSAVAPHFVLHTVSNDVITCPSVDVLLHAVSEYV